MRDVPILVCSCGKRLRAPGAKPGRRGRCPDCGQTIRFPSSEADESLVRPPIATGETAEPVEGTTPSPSPVKKKKKRRPSPNSETAIWDGLIKAPDRLETSLRESLLYPLWGATGIAILVLLPPLFWMTSIPFITSFVTLSEGGQTTFGIGSLFLLLPASIFLFAVLGYALLFLGRVVASSAQGEIHHPRLPDWEFSSIIFGLGRWFWAALIGGVIGGAPAVAYWVYCGDIDLFDRMILAELGALGAAYALMALLASILHEDTLAANPITIFAAIRRIGWGYVQPCLLAGVAVVLGITLLSAAFEVTIPWLSAFLYWAFWFVALYESMIVLRVLGLYYYRHAKELGWFRDRTGWGV